MKKKIAQWIFGLLRGNIEELVKAEADRHLAVKEPELRLVRFCQAVSGGVLGDAAAEAIDYVLKRDRNYPTDWAKIAEANRLVKEHMAGLGVAEKDWKINLAVQLKYALMRGKL